MQRPVKPFDRLVYWIKERESIRLKKEAGLPKPWTTDPVLRAYRFTNVRRMDDKVSQWLLNNWYNPHFDHKNMLMAVGLARFFNKIETLELMTELVFRNGPVKFDSVKKVIEKAKTNGPVFSAAYMVRGKKGEKKIVSAIDYSIKPLPAISVLVDRTSMEKTWENLKSQFGFASFMAGQCIADLRWALSGTWTDKNTWAPIGPGSKKGMNLLHGRESKKVLHQEEFLLELIQLRKDLKEAFPASIFDRIEIMDIQSCLCEFSKMERTIDGSGRPKQKYPGAA